MKSVKARKGGRFGPHFAKAALVKAVGTALYLASPASNFVTGQTIVVDGGRQFN